MDTLLPPAQPLVRAQQPLVACWQAFCQAPGVRLGRWLTTEADRPLIRDYLLGLSQLPTNPLRQLAALPAELAQLNEAGAPVSWLEHLGPNDEKALRTYLNKAPAGRLLVLEDQDAQPLRHLARQLPALVQTVRPAVSAAGLLAGIAAAANPDLPEGRFQQQFQALAAAISRADTPAVVAGAATCQAAAQKLRPNLARVTAAATVALSVAHYLLARRQPAEARHHVAAALAATEAAYERGRPAAGILSIQLWLSEAAAWQQQRRWRQAAAALQLAVARAQLLAANLLGLAAAHQLVTALRRDGQPRAIATCCEQALGFAEQLPAEQRPLATLRELGTTCIKYISTAAGRQALQLRLHALLSP